MTDTLVITGASGAVATMLRPRLSGRFQLRLSDLAPLPEPLREGETFVHADLTDPAAMATLVAGAAGVLHLGGQSTEAEWERVHGANIVGLQTILAACKDAGVPRFIFASSNHAIGFYPRTRRIGIDERVRPDGFYGVSKAFGEALCSLYADKHGLRTLSIRIGNISEKPADRRRLSIWQHPDDLAALITIGLTHPDVHNAIVYGASDNARGWWDNRTAFALGYRPQHRAEDHVAHALAEQEALPADPTGDLFQGGGFCSDTFDGDLPRTLGDLLK